MRMVPDDIVPAVSRENIVVEPLKGTFSPSKGKKRKRKAVIVDSEDETDELFDDDEKERELDHDESTQELHEDPTIINPFDENDINRGFGGDDIYHLLNDNVYEDSNRKNTESLMEDQDVKQQQVTPILDQELIKYRQEKIEKSKEIYKTNGHMDLDKILGTSTSEEIALLNDMYGEDEKPLPLLSFLFHQSLHTPIKTSTAGSSKDSQASNSEMESIQQYIPEQGLQIGNKISQLPNNVTFNTKPQHTSLLPTTKKIKPNFSNDFYND